MRLAFVAVVVLGFQLADVAAGEEPALKTEQERRSYALGVSSARAIRRQGIQIDAGLATRGLEDGLSGKAPLMSDAELAATLSELRAELVSRQSRRQLTAAEAKARGEAFLAENARKEGVVTLPRGLQYKVLRAGEGKKPAGDDRVVCHYRGRFVDGTEFDSSYKRGRPATFDMARVIPGWKEALKLMPVGSKWQLFVPAKLAYGERGVRAKKKSPVHIGPNATLVYEAELLSILPGGDRPTTTDASTTARAASGGG
jgi:FKBP-type peptidyl-prolyl cis-trans isomerase FklB